MAVNATLVIRGGTVVDGTGSPSFTADIAIDGELIVAVGPDLVITGDQRSRPAGCPRLGRRPHAL
jgi:N-acyl-D-aspartate/D-glutamate deacylase